MLSMHVSVLQQVIFVLNLLKYYNKPDNFFLLLKFKLSNTAEIYYKNILF